MFEDLVIELIKLATGVKNSKAQRLQMSLGRVDRLYSHKSGLDRARMKKRRLDSMEGYFRLK